MLMIRGGHGRGGARAPRDHGRGGADALRDDGRGDDVHDHVRNTHPLRDVRHIPGRLTSAEKLLFQSSCRDSMVSRIFSPGKLRDGCGNDRRFVIELPQQLPLLLLALLRFCLICSAQRLPRPAYSI